MTKQVKVNGKKFQVELVGNVGFEEWMNEYRIINNEGKVAELHIAKDERFFEWNT